MSPHATGEGPASRGSAAPSTTDPQPPQTVRIGLALILLEAAGLVALAILLVVDTITGDPQSLVGSLGGAGLALFAAVCLVVLGRYLLHGRRFARTPVMLLQLLALPVGYSMGLQAGLPQYGIPILVLALAVLGLFATPSARAVYLPPGDAR